MCRYLDAAGLLQKNVIHTFTPSVYDSTQGDLNDQPLGSFIFCENGVLHAPTNTDKGYSMIFGTGTWAVQVYLIIDTNKTYIRRFAYSNWSNWIALN